MIGWWAWQPTDQQGTDQEGSMIDRHIPPKPVNCPECGGFQRHVVTCTSWRPVRCDPADILARRAGEWVAATPPDQRSEQIAAISGGPRCSDQRSIDDAGLLGAWEGVAAAILTDGQSDPYTPASSGAQVADSSAWTGRRESGMTPPNTGYQPMPRGAQCWCDYGWFDPAGGFWCCGGTPCMPKYREHPFYERSKAAVIARGFHVAPDGYSVYAKGGGNQRQQESKMAAREITFWVNIDHGYVTAFPTIAAADLPVHVRRDARVGLKITRDDAGLWRCYVTDTENSAWLEEARRDDAKRAWTGRGTYKPMTNGQENKMAASGDVVPEIIKYLAAIEPFVAGPAISLLKRARDRITADGEIIKTVESLAAENRCLRDGVLTDANRRFEERHIADLKKIDDLRIKLGVAEGMRNEMPKTEWNDLDARICAIKKVAHAPYDFTALVKRIEVLERWPIRLQCHPSTAPSYDVTALEARLAAVERQLPAGARSPNPSCPKCGSTIKHDWFVCRGTQEQADIATAARKDTMRELAVQMRTIIRKCVSGTTLDNTDCALLTAILDDYFGDKAGKEITP